MTAGAKTVLITGAAGFAGSHLARALLARGHRVTGLDVTAPLQASMLRQELSHHAFRYIWKSIQDMGPADMEGHPIIVHMAAQPDTPMAFESPRYTVMQNVAGTLELLEAVRRAGSVSKLIYAGSGNEVGRPIYLPIDEEHPLTPHNPYGFSKAAGEMAMWTWHRAYGVPSIVVASGAVIGPHMRREVFIFKWLWEALHGRPIVVEGGRQTRDVTYIDDVVVAWVLVIEAATEDVVGQKFYAGFGKEHSIEELACMCREAVGSSADIEYAPYRPGEEGQREAFSNQKARRILGYDPKTSPVEAIALTAKWVRSRIDTPPGELDNSINSPH